MSEKPAEWSLKLVEQMGREFLLHWDADEQRTARLIEKAVAEQHAGHVVLPVEDVRQAVEALDAALEWAAKYPLQGEASEWDMRASEHVYALIDALLPTLRKHLEGQSR
jgi:hypothetical protein